MDAVEGNSEEQQDLLVHDISGDETLSQDCPRTRYQ